MNYLDALDWLRINYPKYDLSDRIKIIEIGRLPIKVQNVINKYVSRANK